MVNIQQLAYEDMSERRQYDTIGRARGPAASMSLGFEPPCPAGGLGDGRHPDPGDEL
jgi:hypothetical protein